MSDLLLLADVTPIMRLNCVEGALACSADVSVHDCWPARVTERETCMHFCAWQDAKGGRRNGRLLALKPRGKNDGDGAIKY